VETLAADAATDGVLKEEETQEITGTEA
jgi:hypothetical protein